LTAKPSCRWPTKTRPWPALQPGKSKSQMKPSAYAG